MEETQYKTSDTNEYIINYYDTSGKHLVKNGKGVINNYYPSGKVKSIQTINNGLKNGEYFMYKPNGKLRISGYYNNGIMDSLWEEKFITSEQVYQIKSFKNGMKHGVFKEFTISGDLFINGEYFFNIYFI